jgi:hypothetical protein
MKIVKLLPWSRSWSWHSFPLLATSGGTVTIKDQVLAWKIKKAIEPSVTVGDAIQNAIAKWPESI